MKKWALILTLNSLIINCETVRAPKGEFSYSVVNEKHQYIFRDIYLDKKHYTSEYLQMIEENIPSFSNKTSEKDKVKIDKRTNTLTMTCENKINNIKEFTNKIARHCAVLPYWKELQVRKLKSTHFNNKLYAKLKSRFLLNEKYPKFTNAFPPEPSYTQKGTLQRIKINYDKGKEGYLQLNKATAYCMCHDSYMVRIYNSKGKFIWQSHYGMHSRIMPVVKDLDNDGIDEIIIYAQNMGRVHVFQKEN